MSRKTREKVLILLIVTISALAVTAQREQFKVIKEWNFVNFTWSTPESYNEALNKKEYIPQNIVVSGVSFFNGYYYLSLPRMKDGIPATLARVPKESSASPLLEPYPSWEMNRLNDCDALQNSQNVEIDVSGKMWIIDGGRTNTLAKNPVTTCAPKLIIHDITQNKTIRTYHFTEDVLNSSTSFLYDLVIDDTDGGYAYIADNSGKDPGIVVYSLRLNKSWKVRHGDSMKADDDVLSFNVGDVTIKVPINIAGIALGPKMVIDNSSTILHEDRTLYYSPISSLHLYSILSSELRNASFANHGGEFLGRVEDVGVKTGPTDGMIMDNTGVLYYGLLTDSSIAKWNSQTPFTSSQTVISKDKQYIQWPNSFTFDNEGNIILLTNTLHKFIYGKMEIREPNFRLMSLKTDTKSYIALENPLNYTNIDTSDRLKTASLDEDMNKEDVSITGDDKLRENTTRMDDGTKGTSVSEYPDNKNDSSSGKESDITTTMTPEDLRSKNMTRMVDGSIGTEVSGYPDSRRESNQNIDVTTSTIAPEDTRDKKLIRMEDGSLGTEVSGFPDSRRESNRRNDDSSMSDEELRSRNLTRLEDGSLGTVVHAFESGRSHGSVRNFEGTEKLLENSTTGSMGDTTTYGNGMMKDGDGTAHGIDVTNLKEGNETVNIEENSSGMRTGVANDTSSTVFDSSTTMSHDAFTSSSMTHDGTTMSHDSPMANDSINTMPHDSSTNGSDSVTMSHDTMMPHNDSETTLDASTMSNNNPAVTTMSNNNPAVTTMSNNNPAVTTISSSETTVKKTDVSDMTDDHGMVNDAPVMPSDSSTAQPVTQDATNVKNDVSSTKINADDGTNVKTVTDESRNVKSMTDDSSTAKTTEKASSGVSAEISETKPEIERRKGPLGDKSSSSIVSVSMAALMLPVLVANLLR